jgi:hypothetical protein
MVNVVDSRPTPWFWAVNGAAGVLAASIAIATSMAFSINVSLWVGAGCYLLLGPISLALGRGEAVGTNPGQLTGDSNPAIRSS